MAGAGTEQGTGRLLSVWKKSEATGLTNAYKIWKNLEETTVKIQFAGIVTRARNGWMASFCIFADDDECGERTSFLWMTNILVNLRMRRDFEWIWPLQFGASVPKAAASSQFACENEANLINFVILFFAKFSGHFRLNLENWAIAAGTLARGRELSKSTSR